MQIKKPKIPIFRGGLSLTANPYRNLRTSFLLLFLSILSFTFVPYIVAEANAETASLALDWTKVVLELDTGSNSGNVAFNNGSSITPDSVGRVATVAKTLTVNTTGKHFNVYLSMDSSVGTNQKLCYDFDANVVEKSACAHTGIGISPVTEDNDSPARFTGNNWGYALNDGETGFSSAGTYSNANLSGEIISSNTTNAYDLALYNAKWAAVPTFGSEDLIWSADTINPNGFGTTELDGETLTGDSNNTKTVVYGVQVNNGLVAGTYGSKILYTAVASASDLDTPSTNVMSSVVFGGPTDVTTLYMDIDAEGAQIRQSQISIKLIKHSDAVLADANNDDEFSQTEFENAKNLAVANCPVVSNSLESSNGSFRVSCVLPELGLNEGMDYDYIVEIPVTSGLTRRYISYNTDGNDEGVTRYVGLQTKDSNDNYYVQTMQGITAGICSMTNVWGATVGSDARIYNRTGTGVALANSATDSLAIGTGTFQLEDIRDNKEYLVRRLADGNCWMVQNLDLELADFAGKNDTNGGLTPANTDLNSEESKTRGYWDPSASVVALTGSTLTEKLQSKLGADQTCSEQFQSKENAGSGCYWGSKLSDDGNLTPLTDVTNNANAAIPRSYDNGSDWIQNSPSQDGVSGDYKSSGTPTSVNGDNAATLYMGNWYNWYAATAQSGTWEMTSGNATDSICPAGWQLPDNSGDHSWSNLLTTKYSVASSTDGSRRARNYPLSIIFSGYYYWVGGYLNNRGSNGNYWSSTPSSTIDARYLNLYSTRVNPQDSGSKTFGLTVRCVARGMEATTVEEDEEEAVACEAGKICYDGNGGTGTMSDQTASANSDVMLTAPTYNKLGYAFVGWNTQENGFGTTYQANETITTPSTLSSEGLQLYAKWLPSAGEMQNWSGCSTLGEHQTVALTDNRDGKTYAVRKLKDGNCWMVNNLNLELANFAGTNNLTSDNTDLSTSRTDLVDLGNGKKAWDPSASTVAKYQSGETFSDFTLRVLGQAQPAQFQNLDQKNYTWGSRYNESGEEVGTDSSCANKSADDSRSTYRTNLGYCVESNSRTEIPRSYNYESYGIYNWYAATAESGKYLQDSSSPNADSSICPAGWRLPTFGNKNTDKTWTKLVMNSTNGYGLIETSGVQTSANNPTYGETGASLALNTTPIALNYSGYLSFGDGHLGGRRTEGDYWTSQAYNHHSASRFYARSNSIQVAAGDASTKIDGIAVRCVNRD